MKWFKSVTDEELIESLRSGERLRRKVGYSQAMLGLAMALIISGMTAYYFRKFTDPADHSLTGDRMSFFFGMLLGGFAGGAMYKSIHLIVEGLTSALVRSRRDRLLVRLWDESHPMTFSEVGDATPASVTLEETYAESSPACRR